MTEREERFRKMFFDNDIAKGYCQGKTKVKYVIQSNTELHLASRIFLRAISSSMKQHLISSLTNIIEYALQRSTFLNLSVKFGFNIDFLTSNFMWK